MIKILKCYNLYYILYIIQIVVLYFYNLNTSYQLFTVPEHVNNINVKMYGAEGGNGNIFGKNMSNIKRGIPGKGGYINANIPVIKNQILYLFIGKKGVDSSLNSSHGIGIGGFNGGGNGYNAGGSNYIKEGDIIEELPGYNSNDGFIIISYSV